MKKYIVGNWKMNGNSEKVRDFAVALVDLFQDKMFEGEPIICPPYPYLGLMGLRFLNSSITLGGQDCSVEKNGAFTGQISAEMLKDVGCRYVILGHSERRQYYQETNESVFKKAQSALSVGLIPIICIGETLKEREDGDMVPILIKQMQACVPDGNCIVAYEPIWAIGTGKVPSLIQIKEVHAALFKEKPEIPFLYGGSVKADNAAEIMQVPHVNGLLVGGASLDSVEYGNILLNVLPHK